MCQCFLCMGVSKYCPWSWAGFKGNHRCLEALPRGIYNHWFEHMMNETSHIVFFSDIICIPVSLNSSLSPFVIWIIYFSSVSASWGFTINYTSDKSQKLETGQYPTLLRILLQSLLEIFQGEQHQLIVLVYFICVTEVSISFSSRIKVE